MITEIGDAKHFAHPCQLSSWIDRDVRENSSDNKSNRLGVTRQRNLYLRAAFVEAN